MREPKAVTAIRPNWPVLQRNYQLILIPHLGYKANLGEGSYHRVIGVGLHESVTNRDGGSAFFPAAQFFMNFALDLIDNFRPS